MPRDSGHSLLFYLLGELLDLLFFAGNYEAALFKFCIELSNVSFQRFSDL